MRSNRIMFAVISIPLLLVLTVVPSRPVEVKKDLNAPLTSAQKDILRPANTSANT